MSDAKVFPGSIVWQDLTIKDADAIQRFYAAVVGWKPRAEESCGGDFNMLKSDGNPAAGICYARGVNETATVGNKKFSRISSQNQL